MKNSDYIKNSIKNLKDYAKSKGFKIVWRNVTTNCGGFLYFHLQSQYWLSFKIFDRF